MIATHSPIGVGDKTIMRFVAQVRTSGEYNAKEVLDWFQAAIPSAIGQMILLRALWHLDGDYMERPGWSTAIFDQERT